MPGMAGSSPNFFPLLPRQPGGDGGEQGGGRASPGLGSQAAGQGEAQALPAAPEGQSRANSKQRESHWIIPSGGGEAGLEGTSKIKKKKTKQIKASFGCEAKPPAAPPLGRSAATRAEPPGKSGIIIHGLPWLSWIDPSQDSGPAVPLSVLHSASPMAFGHSWSLLLDPSALPWSWHCWTPREQKKGKKIPLLWRAGAGRAAKKSSH